MPFLLQDVRSGNIIPIGQSGFLMLKDQSVNIYEWNDGNESLELSALKQDQVLTNLMAMAVNADQLFCQ